MSYTFQCFDFYLGNFNKSGLIKSKSFFAAMFLTLS